VSTTGERERVTDHQVNTRRPLPNGSRRRRPPWASGRLHAERLHRAEVGGQPQRDGGLGLDLAGPQPPPRHAADQWDLAGLLGDPVTRSAPSEEMGEANSTRTGRQAPQRRPGSAHRPLAASRASAVRTRAPPASSVQVLCPRFVPRPSSRPGSRLQLEGERADRVQALHAWLRNAARRRGGRPSALVVGREGWSARTTSGWRR